MHRYFVYILCSKRNGTLYIGVTNDIVRRVKEHKQKLVPGFTTKYEYIYIQDALQREKQLKQFYRIDKLRLIEQFNPEWKDLYYDIFKQTSE